MEEPKNFGKRFGVLNIAIVIVMSFYFMIGFLGYIKYGDSVEASITLSLPREPLYDSVQIVYAFAVLLTYPIIMYVPIEMLWPNILKKLSDSKKSSFTISLCDYSFRTFLVVITCKSLIFYCFKYLSFHNFMNVYTLI
jgi:proton-coupled amino acid transporter